MPDELIEVEITVLFSPEELLNSVRHCDRSDLLSVAMNRAENYLRHGELRGVAKVSAHAAGFVRRDECM